MQGVTQIKLMLERSCINREIKYNQLVQTKDDVSETHLILKINIGAGSDESIEQLSVTVHSCIMSRCIPILQQINNGKLEYCC